MVDYTKTGQKHPVFKCHKKTGAFEDRTYNRHPNTVGALILNAFEMGLVGSVLISNGKTSWQPFWLFPFQIRAKFCCHF